MRAELVNRLAAAGLPRVEAVSFVRDDRVPQMAGAEDVVAAIERRAGTEYSGLVLNERGWERFAASGLDRVNVTFAATQTFNERNGNASLAEAVARADAILAAAGTTPATVTISVCFGCPFEGRVDPGVVAELAGRFTGRAEVVLADTIGVATPRAVRGLVERTRRGRLPRAQHAQHRLCELPRRARGGRAPARRVRRRPRRLPLRASRDRQRRDRRPRLPARRRGNRDGRRPRRAHRRLHLAREPARPQARGLRVSRGPLAASARVEPDEHGP